MYPLSAGRVKGSFSDNFFEGHGNPFYLFEWCGPMRGEAEVTVRVRDRNASVSKSFGEFSRAKTLSWQA